MIKIVEIEPLKKEEMKRRAGKVKDISAISAKSALEDKTAYAVAAGIGIVKGLETRSFRAGAISGIAVFSGIVGANVIGDLIKNADDIKKA